MRRGVAAEAPDLAGGIPVGVADGPSVSLYASLMTDRRPARDRTPIRCVVSAIAILRSPPFHRSGQPRTRSKASRMALACALT